MTLLQNIEYRLVCLLILWMAVPGAGKTQTIPASNPDAPAVPVYVNDFELSAQGANGPTPAAPAGASKRPEGTEAAANAATSSPSVFLDTDTPSVRARKIIDFFSSILTQTLQKSGFTSKREEAGRPEKGAMLRGIFAEVDPMNRIRKAILGGSSTNAKFTLYVGTFNLARPDQPLYQLAPVQSPDPRFGPVLTLNNYVPMEKFELNKSPTEEDIRKICAQIVNHLEELLKENAPAFAQ
jgi:hypothetical protein